MPNEVRTRIMPSTGTPSFSDMESAEKSGLTIPPVDPKTGGQVGRLPPAVRKVTAHYDAVDLDTAVSRMRARARGDMPPIAGGLDGPGVLDLERAKRKYGGKLPDELPQESVDQALADSPDNIPEAGPPKVTLDGHKFATTVVPNDALLLLLQQMSSMMMRTQQTAQQVPVIPPPVMVPPPESIPAPPVLNAFDPDPIPAPRVDKPIRVMNMPKEALKLAPVSEYLGKRTRVSFSVVGGTYSIPAVDVKACAAGLVILLPVDKESATFVPSLGAEVTVEFEGKLWSCFFPGIAVTLEALGLQVLSFVYQDDKQGHASSDA